MKQQVWGSGRRTRRRSGRGTAWQRALMLLLVVLMVAALAPASVALAEESSEDSKWKRLAGNGRYDTMEEIVREGFESSEWAIIATGKSFPDALVASSVAGAFDAPIILTKPNELSKQASQLIDDLGVKYVFIMGGKSAVSENVYEQIKAKPNVTSVGRIDGTSRQATSVAAMNRLDEFGKLEEPTVVIATGKNFADALSIGPFCYRYHIPILLTKNDGTLTQGQVEACKRIGIKTVLIVGGKSVVSDKVWDQLGLVEDRDGTRVSGDDRYKTSKEVARYVQLLGWNAKHVGVATGKDFPDALAGAALCGKNKSYLLLVKDENSATLDLINADSGIETGYVLGGASAVSEDLYAYLQERANSHYEIVFQ